MSTISDRPKSEDFVIEKRASEGRKTIAHPRVYDFVLERMDTYGNPEDPIPTRVILIRPNPQDISEDQLFVDQMPIPPDAWRYDAADRTISWRGAYGGGHLHVSHDGTGAYGNVGDAHNPVSVSAAAKAVFDCDVALNVGATYVSSGGSIVGLQWDTTSTEWTSAAWVKKRLKLTYTVTPNGPILPPTFSFEFEDLETGAIPWDPVDFSASLSLSQYKGLMVWNLIFKSTADPDPDPGHHTGPDTVYPYWLMAREDSAAATINGVLQIDANAPQGTLVGMQGVRAAPGAVGYFRTSHDKAPFAVFDGKLIIGGSSIATSHLSGSTLSWTALDSDHQDRTGLPESGTLEFEHHGFMAAQQAGVTAQRLSSTEALNAIEQHNDLHADVHARSMDLMQALADTKLDIYGLLAMNPFTQDDKGAWGDAVQQKVTGDLSDMMNSFIPSDIWKLLFPNMNQPSLSGELAIVANSPVPGVEHPADWYKSLAVSVLTQGMADGSDVNCRNMNGPRAGEWLKTQVATSAVYHTHGQLLFNYEWQQRFQLTNQYLQDQINNSATYATAIDAQVTISVADINENVAADPSDPTMKPNLIKQVQAAGDYAKTNNLYWAFAYYTYNTAPSILANIALQIGIQTGSSDGTTLTRLIQQNASVLTALDPSGFFAQQYTSTLNTFLATNILPSMFGFLGDASSFDIVKQYLQKFVDENIANEDKKIAEAAQQIKSILEDRDADAILHTSIEALRDISSAIQDALALPYVAKNFVTWFSNTFPRFAAIANTFSSVFIGGLTGLAVFNLFTEFKSWDKLSDAEKAELIIDTIQIGLQILAAVVKRGIRIYSIFNVNGMTKMQRAAAISKIIVNGEVDVMEQGLVRIGNSAARWLADTEGTVGQMAGAAVPLLANQAVAGAQQAGWAAKIFGKNLDEFIATRLGPILILAGIALSIYFISTGESGLALASDILNIVSGSLMLFAMVGGWLIEGGVIAAGGVMAGIISVAGPLAIVAALVGVAIMIYLMFQKPPDPVETFVNQYVKPAGLYVSSQASSIDYAVPYANPDQGELLMIGFSLSAGGKYLQANNDHTIGLTTENPLSKMPNHVWVSSTDGLGMSKIMTIIQPDSTQPPITVYLSLMSDNSISFQPAMPPPKPPTLAAKSKKKAVEATAGDAPTVVTQTWLSAPKGDASITSKGGHLVSINLTFQPIKPDSKGNYAPSQAQGWLTQTATGLGYDPNNGTTFTLNMSGMAPNYMKMVDIHFLLDSTPSLQQKFGPSFGVYASTPCTYEVTGGTPSFVNFDKNTGAITPNGGKATPASETNNTISAKNALGSGSANFKIVVAPAPPPPTPSTSG